MSGILNLLLGSAAGVIKDAYFNLVTLLLNTTATNGAQNNTFLDSSTNNFSITRNGNTTQGTFTPFSQTGWGNYFDGTSSYLSTSSSTFACTGDFTVEAWFYATSNPEFMGIINTRPQSNTTGLAINIDNTQKIRFYINGTDFPSGYVAYNLNQWYHVALVRNGSGTNNVTAYVNGSSVGSLTDTSTTSTTNLVIGRFYTDLNSYYMRGYISNARFVNGTALYTSNFTPSTTPLTAVTNTKLLTCQSNRFLDNSTNALTITPNGTPSVQAFSPFVPDTAYSTSLVGGSGYFDGTGDWLNTPTSSNFVTSGDFTIEAWAYNTGRTNNYQGIVSQRSASGGPAINTNNTGTLEFQFSGTIIASTTMPVNQWFHVAMSRSGTGSNNISVYLNGTRLAQASINTSTTTNNLAIGRYYTDLDDYYWLGYIASARYTTSAVYSGATITVPTAPVTAVANTQLLLNYTNAGIYDAAAKNVAETVGNAQVSTTVAKFGTTSMAFDGTGDNLKSKLTNAIGSGDYTIEGFFYASGSGIQYLFDMRETSQAIGAYIIGATTALNVNFGTTFDIAASLAFTLNSWNHLAFVRSGSGSNNTSVFLNGSRVYQRTDTTDYSIVPNIFIGCENSGNYYLNGYIDEFRITKGYARYSGSTYTVPAAAFPIQ